MIYIDLSKALQDNIEFLLSENGVVLTSGIDGVLHPKYFTHVVKTSTMSPFDPDYPNPRTN